MSEKERQIIDRLTSDLRIPLRDARHQGSVTERLSARLDALEPVVARILSNEAKLIADSLLTERAIGEERTHRLKLAQEQRSYVDNEYRRLALVQGAMFNSLTEFCGRSFWQRLRWLVTGR